jgi:hypothetical protein
MEERHESSTNAIIFSRSNIKKFIATLLIFLGIWGLYSLLSGFLMGRPAPPDGIGPGKEIGILTSKQPPSPPPMGLGEIWPLWGSISQLDFIQILIAVLIFAGFCLLVVYGSKKINRGSSILLIATFGVVLIIATNLIHGWQIGIIDSLAGLNEVYWDVSKVTTIIDFISNYAEIQQTLSTHATTQPPGLVIFIYLLNIILNDPALCAIALCVVATFCSCFFLYKIFQHFVDVSSAKYIVFLFILLPAVQIYYLANIYAINATLAFGTIYFYLHEKKGISIIGSIICLFLLVFTTFLSLWLPLFLGIFELLNLHHKNLFEKATFQQFGLVKWIKKVILEVQKLAIICIAVLSIFVFLYVAIGFNYIEAFLYASHLENADGFMLFADPLSYFVSRAQNILDIVFCFGPILIVLFYQGILAMKNRAKDNDLSYKMYAFVIAAFLALLLLFIAGAPKKGETARICMFILPFLLLPVITWINQNKVSQNEKIKLAIFVFLQAITMQLFFTFVW